MFSRVLHQPIIVTAMRWTYRGLRRVGLARLAVQGKVLLSRLGGDHVVVTTSEGWRLQGSVDQIGELSELGKGTYESGTLALFRAALRPGARVLDLGANIGVFTTLAAHSVGSGGHVVAVEPDPRNIRHLRANVEHQSLKNVEIVAAAVGAQSGTGHLHAAMAATNSTLYPVLLENNPSAGVVEIPIFTVDELVDARPVDVIKMDIEGAEWAALDGMTMTIDANPGLIMFIEYEEGTLKAAGASPARLIARLRSHWRQVYVIDEERRVLFDPDDWQMVGWQNVVCASASYSPGLPVERRRDSENARDGT